jgi:crossover junction endodeoxyribonuclease RuvC
VHARPGEGAVGAFSFGRAAGIVETAAHACGLTPRFVSPAMWKGALRCPADKTKARALASKLFPSAAHHWTRVKDDGRAEGALIAYYGLSQVLQLQHKRPNVVW